MHPNSLDHLRKVNQAISSKDYARIEQLVAGEMEQEAKDCALWVAFRDCDPQAIDLLVRAGANLDTVWQKVLEFVMDCSTKTIELALSYGMDVRLRDKSGNTLIHRVTNYEHIYRDEPDDYNALFEKMALFKNLGLDFNDRKWGGMGDTPLRVALEHDCPLDFLRALLRCGAIVDIGETDLGYTALHRAVGNLEYLKVMLEETVFYPIAHNVDATTPMHCAESAECEKILLSMGALPSRPSYEEEEFELNRSISREHFRAFILKRVAEIADEIPPQGGGFATRSRDGFTVLHHDLDDLSVRLQNNDLQAMEPFRERLSQYLAAGVDINDRRNEKFMPPLVQWILHWVHNEKCSKLDRNFLEVVRLLMEHGAVIDILYGFDGMTIIHELASMTHATPECLPLLRWLHDLFPFCRYLRTGYDGKTLLMVAVDQGSLECVKYVIDELRAVEEMDFRDPVDRTALMLLVEKVGSQAQPGVPDWERKLHLLIEKGADPRIRTNFENEELLVERILNSPPGSYRAEIVKLFRQYA